MPKKILIPRTVIRDYQRGDSIKRIAKRLGYSTRPIRSFLAAQGIPIRDGVDAVPRSSRSIVGRRFGALLCIRRIPAGRVGGSQRCEVQCVCGRRKIINSSAVHSGHVRCWHPFLYQGERLTLTEAAAVIGLTREAMRLRVLRAKRLPLPLTP